MRLLALVRAITLYLYITDSFMMLCFALVKSELQQAMFLLLVTLLRLLAPKNLSEYKENHRPLATVYMFLQNIQQTLMMY
jgi:hypothetical protein